MSSNKNQLQQICEYVNNLLCTYQPASQLLPLNPDNCIQSLHDGVLLCYVVNKLSPNGQVIKQSQLKKNKPTLFHKMDQVNKALDAAKKVGLNIVNVRAQFIVEKKQNTILGLFNQIKNQRPGQKLSMKKAQSNRQSQQRQQQKPPQKFQQVKQVKTQQNIKQKIIQKVQAYTKQPKDKGDFVLEQSQAPQNTNQTIKHQIIQNAPPVHKQVPAQSPKQRVAKMTINSHQVISKQSQVGYNFQDVQGPQIVVLVGSLRKSSVNHGMVHALQMIKTQKHFSNIYFHTPNLNILPLVNSDLVSQNRVPKAVKDLCELVKKSQGILIATPQYNGSFSGIIKNTFDWLAVDNPSPLINKKIGIISASYLTQNQIRDITQMGEHHKCIFSPSHYISLRSKAFNMESGYLQDNQQIDKLAMWYQDYSNFILSHQQFPQPIPRFIMKNE